MLIHRNKFSLDKKEVNNGKEENRCFLKKTIKARRED
jgi:hypothetical protein